VSAYPIVLEGKCLSALVVGGGSVAVRKVRALLDAGAKVHVIAPEIAPELVEWAASDAEALRITQGSYAPDHLALATLVVAATDSRTINASVVEDARKAGKLVNAADAPEQSDFVTPAVHRAGDIVVAVVAGGVPAAAARIRDAIAESVDGRYAHAVDALSRLRRKLLDRGERDTWRKVSAAAIDENFCARVEAGTFSEELDAWR
jgi:siroheme synthase-like protein